MDFMMVNDGFHDGKWLIMDGLWWLMMAFIMVINWWVMMDFMMVRDGFYNGFWCMMMVYDG